MTTQNASSKEQTKQPLYVLFKNSHHRKTSTLIKRL